MAERNETLIEGDILFKDLKSKRKTERITLRSLSKIVENKTKNTNKLRDMHRRASLFSIKYVLANITEPMVTQEKKATVKFYNELAESKLTEDEMQKKAKQYAATLTGNRNAYRDAMDEIKLDGINIPFEIQLDPKRKLKKNKAAVAEEKKEDDDFKDHRSGARPSLLDLREQADKKSKALDAIKEKYKELKLGKQAPIKLTEKEKKHFGGEPELKLTFARKRTYKGEKWEFEYDKYQKDAGFKLIDDIKEQEYFIINAGNSLVPYLQQNELLEGIANALRIVFKAFIKGKPIDENSEAAKKANEILDKLKARAELNDSKELKFYYSEDLRIL